MDVLKEMDGDRRCYRLVGDSSLVEYNVRDALEILGGSLLKVSVSIHLFHFC